jgi:HEAT repeat protein
MRSSFPSIAAAAALALAVSGGRSFASPDPTMGAEGPEAARFVGRQSAECVTGLRDADPAVRARAARALGDLGPDAADAVPELLRLQCDPDPGVQAEAVAAVCRVGGPRAREMVRQILLDGKDKKVPFFSPGVLRKASPAVLPPLRALLTDDEVQSAALGALGPDAASAVPSLRGALADGDAPTRAAAARALGLIRPAASEVVPALARAFHDADALVRVRSAAALGALDPTNTAPVPVLAAALRDVSPAARAEAADALRQLGPAARGAAPDLAEALKGSDDDLAGRADAALRAVGPDAMPAVIAALADRTAPNRPRVFDLVQSFGQAAADAAPLLRQALDGPDGFDRVRAAEALAAVVPEAAEEGAPALLAAASSDDPALVVFAAEAAARVGPAAAAVGSALALALHHPDARVRLAAADALVRLDHRNAAAALPVLTEALGGPGDGRQAALRTLIALGPDGRPAAPALLSLLAAEVHRPAGEGVHFWPLVKTLVKVGAGADAVPLLLPALADKDDDRREEALEALRLVGPDARAALPALRPLLKDEDESVREQAVDLWSILTGQAVPGE